MAAPHVASALGQIFFAIGTSGAAACEQRWLRKIAVEAMAVTIARSDGRTEGLPVKEACSSALGHFDLVLAAVADRAGMSRASKRRNDAAHPDAALIRDIQVLPPTSEASSWSSMSSGSEDAHDAFQALAKQPTEVSYGGYDQSEVQSVLEVDAKVADHPLPCCGAVGLLADAVGGEVPLDAAVRADRNDGWHCMPLQANELVARAAWHENFIALGKTKRPKGAKPKALVAMGGRTSCSEWSSPVDRAEDESSGCSELGYAGKVEASRLRGREGRRFRELMALPPVDPSGNDPG